MIIKLILLGVYVLSVLFLLGLIIHEIFKRGMSVGDLFVLLFCMFIPAFNTLLSFVFVYEKMKDSGFLYKKLGGKK